MSSPIYPLLIIAAYMYIVQVLGPKLMENRKPFNIKNMLIGYNILQVVWNAYIFYKVSKYVFEDAFECGPIDYRIDQRGFDEVHWLINFS
ncbi:hypothetical protein JTB14_016734 [Gonioctena quinquepunctata]|nr:hypothetical protein JTB14_016734 [Gonioctena quinquepunctata]